MDINQLLQMLGLTGGGQAPQGVTAGMAMGQGATPFQPPRNDANLLQLLKQFIQNAQSAPQLRAGNAGYERALNAVKQPKPMSLPGLLPSAFNSLSLAPFSTDMINQILQQVGQQPPQG